AVSRLRAACEGLRRVLSANRDASFSLECLVGETDVSGCLTRAQLEEMAARSSRDLAEA
ncbi:hypothetical protein EMIHUDRAFT_77947, partial [Emiliania huxleyi CCMP1516]|uniref:Uncharacterized protein n=2 Tax=Emiliania huxleyi TaxID=2903 RepID=A0A0D3KL31_EMIH1